MKYNDNGEIKELKVKVVDTLPVGSIMDYDGDTIPSGWEEVEENLPSKMEVGSVISNINNNSWTTITYTYNKKFTSVDAIFIQEKSYNNASCRIYQPVVSTITNTNCTFNVFNVDSTRMQEYSVMVVGK